MTSFFSIRVVKPVSVSDLRNSISRWYSSHSILFFKSENELLLCIRANLSSSLSTNLRYHTFFRVFSTRLPGWGLPLLGPRFTKNFDNLKIFENFDLKMQQKWFGGGVFSTKFLWTFSTKNDLFDRKTPFLAKRKLRNTNIKLKIAKKLKNTGFMVIFRRFGAKH